MGSYLVMVGASLKLIAEVLGHTEVRMAGRYSHLAPAEDWLAGLAGVVR